MARFGFCGPTYQSQSVIADAQRCVNWYPEIVESGAGKSQVVLYPTPGLKTFSNPSGYGLGGYGGGGYGIGQTANSVRALYAFNGRCFAVLEFDREQNLVELFSDGTFAGRGTLGAIGSPASIAANNANQLIVASAGRLFLLNLTTNALSEIDTTTGTVLQGAVLQVGFCDGFFIALLKNSQKFQISNLLDGSVWNPTMIAEVSVFADNIVGMLIDHREVWFWGEKSSIVYYDSGDPLFPFNPVPGTFIEDGSGSAWAQVRLDNSVFWIEADERGNGIARRAQGYSPVRISTHAVEYAWSQYPNKVSDAIGFPYQDQGHTFWVLYFPSGNATWVYDAATGLWHERTSWDAAVQKYGAHLAQNHVFAFGKHLVGDRSSGKIYEMNINYTDDAGTPIQRMRRAPHISMEQQWMFHQQVQVDLEVGLGPQFTGYAPPDCFYLKDSTGQIWQVCMTDLGQVSTVQASEGVVIPRIFTDPLNLQSFQLGISTIGAITLTNVKFNALFPFTLPMVSTSGTLRFTLGVVSLGGSPVLGNLTVTPAGTIYRGPLMTLRWSNDGGKTWSNEYSVDCGQAGDYGRRAVWRRLGRARDRVYEITVSDPVPWRIVDAYLMASPGYVPQERFVSQMRKQA